MIGASLLLCILSSEAKAQRTCATDQYEAQMLADNPKYGIIIDQIRAQSQQWIQNNINAQTSKKAVITIPVVVHVVYNTNAQNISDAQISSQITVLNEDYRRTNADATNTPTAFLNVAADSEIEFCLAQQDPNGNASTGITRTNTTTTSFSTNDNVKLTSNGGKDAWPRDDYLNIWVCNLGNSLLGYATPPGGQAWRDGVVVLYTAFGTLGTASSPFDKGRTTTHEVGHWLNVNHTFNGGCAGTTSSNCASAGDFICDTPPTSSPNYFCPSTSQNTCTETPTDLNDMHMNFMDYTNDACMNLFTTGQKNVMVATLNGSRASILSSIGCVNPVGIALDAGISLIISPTGTACNTTVTPVVTIQNFGTTTLTSATINYDVDGGTNNTASWTGSLATNTTENVTLPGITVSAGGHTFNASTTAPNSGTDGDGGNDASSQTFTISTSGSSLPFTEGFEGGTFPPSGWTLDNPDANVTWSAVTTASGFGNSSACLQMDFYSAAENIQGQSDYLYTVSLDLSNASSPTVMDFNLAYTKYDATYFDSLYIYGSSDCGLTWQVIYANGSTAMQTAVDDTSYFIPTNSQWTAESINLDAYNGNSSFQLLFHAKSYWGNNLYIDDINIYTNSSGTPPVTNFTASTTSICEGESVTFTDVSTNSPTQWAWSFTGGSPSTSTSQNPNVVYSTTGSYTVSLTATNSDGSNTKTTNGMITVNASPALTVASTDATCGSCDGTATASGSSGASPYTYIWGTSPIQSGAMANNLCTGTYLVTVTDANGCSETSTLSVASGGGSLTASSTSNSTSCLGACDGVASAAGANGATPYTYAWNTSPTQSTSIATGLCAGNYDATVTDASGCVATTSVTIGSGPSILASATSTDANCANVCDGNASVTISGGTAPFNYYWNSSPSQSTSIATGLCAGNYGVAIEDANGCTASDQITINEPIAISNTTSSTDATCGVSDGSASVSASNGITPYSYLWSDGQTSSMASSLAASVYYVTVTDDNGCTSVSSVSVSNVGAPIMFTIAQSPLCYGGSDGSASITASGGTLPYSFLWSDAVSQTNSIATGLTAGIYNVTLTDSSSCIATSVITITEPALLSTSLTYIKVSSDSTCDGSASANVTGGTPPYTYLWNDPAAQTLATAFGLCLGSQTVAITDANGCTTTKSIYVDSVVMGIIVIQQSFEFNIYPNPTTGVVHLDFGENDNRDVNVSVFDISGKIILLQDIAGTAKENYNIDLSEYSRGIYYVRVHDGKSVHTKKISLIR